jgi:thioester reductase-like protein
VSEIIISNGLNLAAEATLDPAIHFTAPLAAHARHPQRIFLTGSTGLLGGYLLGELLHQTAAEMVCLVRAESLAEAKQRLRKNLQFYDRWQDDFERRITPAIGDLAQPLLGLAERQFRELSGQIDAIYHSGSWVNNMRSYASLKPTNVSGTVEVIRLAGLTHTKPLHFVSSLAIYFTAAHVGAGTVYETDTPQYHPQMKSGYTQSKWVADQLVQQAQKRGLPAAIYRPVRITAESKTGKTNNLKDLLNLLIKSCLYLKKFPLLDISIPMLPVDYASQAIVHLSQRADSPGKAFHLINSDPLPWRRLLEAIERVGYEFEVIAFPAWQRHLKQQVAQNPEQPFLKLLQGLLSAPNNLFFARPAFDVRQTRAGLAGTDIVCPPVDEKLVATYLAYCQQVRFLPPVDRVPGFA